jgi:rhomboid protease GluP
VTLPERPGPGAPVQQRLPPAPFCWAVIAASVGMFLYDQANGYEAEGVLKLGALYGPAVAEGQWYRILWNTIEHYGPIHVLFNMSAVWTLGQSLERAIGTWRMALLSLGTALGASALALGFAFDAATAGASGMILGWGGAMISIATQQGRRSLTTWLIQVAVISLLPGISWQGHLGGFLFGLPMGWALRDGSKRFPIIAPIVVFLGAIACVAAGKKPAFAAAAVRLGAEMARRKLGLVYGGAMVGMMGAIADSVLENGGEVYGVIPGGLAAKEIAHPRLTKLHVVDTMHQRKALMEQLSDAFIAMPGGFGTFEEILEIITWMQLGLHRKPAGLLNVDGYYAPLLAQVQRGLEEGFIPAPLEQAIVADEDPARLLERMLAHEIPAPTVKWITREQT